MRLSLQNNRVVIPEESTRFGVVLPINVWRIGSAYEPSADPVSYAQPHERHES